MRLLLRIVDALCALGGIVAALAVAALAAMLIVEVVATSFLAWSQPWAVEYSAYLLCASLFVGAGWTLREGGHVRVEVLTNRLSVRGRMLADLFGTVFALGVAGYAAWALVEFAARSAQVGSESSFPTRTPLVWPQAVLAGGWVVLTLGLAARALRLLVGLEPERAGEVSAEEGAGLAGMGSAPSREGGPA